jgi:hypothetical protein
MDRLESVIAERIDEIIIKVVDKLSTLFIENNLYHIKHYSPFLLLDILSGIQITKVNLAKGIAQFNNGHVFNPHVWVSSQYNLHKVYDPYRENNAEIL